MRWLRIIVSAAFLALFMTGLLLMPGELGQRLLHGVRQWQFFPALQQFAVSRNLLPAVILVPVITFIFGRIYCSTVCPLGTIQDLFIRRKRKFTYRQANKLARWAFPIASLLLAGFGIQLLLILLEPFATAGRLGENIVKPGAALLWRPITLASHYFELFLQPLPLAFELSAFILAILQLAVLIALVLARGRFYCNYLCPVGAVLSVFSRYSLFRIRIDQNKCVSCGKCRNACKAECLDLEHFRVDADRCLTCFSCVGDCPKNAISYGWFGLKSPQPAPMVSKLPPMARRDFLIMTSAAACAVPLAAGASKLWQPSLTKAIVPPGGRSLAHFTKACTGCHLCVAACPEKVLRPADTQYGLAGFQQPVMDFTAGYCGYQCNTCGQVCPNGAIQPLTLEEKQHVSIGTAEVFASLCVAYLKNKACGACDEVCPVGAVHMIDSPNGKQFPPVPVMKPEICLGCGACEKACPERAIIVKARQVHRPVVFDQPANTENRSEAPPTDGFAF